MYKLILLLVCCFISNTVFANDIAYLTDGKTIGIFDLDKKTMSGYVKPLPQSKWFPRKVVFNADHSLAYVINGTWWNRDTAGIAIVDTKTGNEIAETALPHWASSFAIAPNGQYAYVGSLTNSVTGTTKVTGINILDLKSNKIVGSVKDGKDEYQGGAWPILFTPDGKYAVCGVEIPLQYGSFDSGIFLIDTATHNVIAKIMDKRRIDIFNSDLALSKDGKKLYVASHNILNAQGDLQDAVRIIDLPSLRVTKSIFYDMDSKIDDDAATPQITVSAEGDRIYVRRRVSIVVIDALHEAYSHHKTVAEGDQILNKFMLSPDKSKLYLNILDLNPANNISTIDLGTEESGDRVWIDGLDALVDMNVFSGAAG